MKDTELIYNQLKKNNYQIIIKAYLECDMALQKVNFDSKESGCTCNLIINIGNHIICANTGDSRAIAVADESQDWRINYKYIPLSIDFKPEMPEEMSRILLSGGEMNNNPITASEFWYCDQTTASNLFSYSGLAFVNSK